jgi:hypothetical protein
MESPENKQRKINDPDIMKIITVGALVIILIAVFFVVTRGNDIVFCLFSSNCKSVIIDPPPPIVNPFIDLLAVGAGVATAAVLTAVIETPVIVAVGVGIAVWWIVNALL